MALISGLVHLFFSRLQVSRGEVDLHKTGFKSVIQEGKNVI